MSKKLFAFCISETVLTSGYLWAMNRDKAWDVLYELENSGATDNARHEYQDDARDLELYEVNNTENVPESEILNPEARDE